MYFGVLILFAILQVMMILTLNISNQQSSALQTASLRSSLLGINEQMRANLTSDTLWQSILAESDTGECNAALKCVRDGTDCGNASSAWQPLNCVFRYSLGSPPVPELWMDLRTSTTGLSMAGEPCTSFDPESTERACPLKPTVEFRVMCSTPPCQFRPVQIRVKYESNKSAILNAGNFGFTVTQW